MLSPAILHIPATEPNFVRLASLPSKIRPTLLSLSEDHLRCFDAVRLRNGSGLRTNIKGPERVGVGACIRAVVVAYVWCSV